MKYLLVLVVVVVGALWWVRARALSRRRDAAPAPSESTVQEMVRCAQCGLHLPRADAISDGPDHYCGEPHRRLGRRRT